MPRQGYLLLLTEPCAMLIFLGLSVLDDMGFPSALQVGKDTSAAGFSYRAWTKSTLKAWFQRRIHRTSYFMMGVYLDYYSQPHQEKQTASEIFPHRRDAISLLHLFSTSRATGKLLPSPQHHPYSFRSRDWDHECSSSSTFFFGEQ